jgi:hypothetical protein
MHDYVVFSFLGTARSLAKHICPKRCSSHGSRLVDVTQKNICDAALVRRQRCMQHVRLRPSWPIVIGTLECRLCRRKMQSASVNNKIAICNREVRHSFRMQLERYHKVQRMRTDRANEHNNA